MDYDKLVALLREGVAELDAAADAIVQLQARVAELEPLESAMKRQLAGLCPYPAHGRADDLSIAACVSSGECGCSDGEGEKLRISEASLASVQCAARDKDVIIELHDADLAAALERNEKLEYTQDRWRSKADAMRQDLAAARAAEQQLRHLLFLAHGNAEHYLYGDDGERQCNTCMIDFNVDTPNEIAQKITNYWNRKYALAGKDAP
jgi:hypothetical protein